MMRRWKAQFSSWIGWVFQAADLSVITRAADRFIQGRMSAHPTAQLTALTFSMRLGHPGPLQKIRLFPASRAWQRPAMRFLIFLVGLCILATSAVALQQLPKPQAMQFLDGALKLGGGIVICGIFSLKMPWHGIVGAGILALLGLARGLGNLPGLLKFLAGDRSHDTAPLLEAGVTALCLLLFVRVIREFYRERLRRMLEQAD
jgi:HAMP domain-containing protein